MSVINHRNCFIGSPLRIDTFWLNFDLEAVYCARISKWAMVGDRVIRGNLGARVSVHQFPRPQSLTLERHYSPRAFCPTRVDLNKLRFRVTNSMLTCREKV